VVVVEVARFKRRMQWLAVSETKSSVADAAARPSGRK